MLPWRNTDLPNRYVFSHLSQEITESADRQGTDRAFQSLGAMGSKAPSLLVLKQTHKTDGKLRIFNLREQAEEYGWRDSDKYAGDAFNRKSMKRPNYRDNVRP